MRKWEATPAPTKIARRQAPTRCQRHASEAHSHRGSAASSQRHTERRQAAPTEWARGADSCTKRARQRPTGRCETNRHPTGRCETHRRPTGRRATRRARGQAQEPAWMAKREGNSPARTAKRARARATSTIRRTRSPRRRREPEGCASRSRRQRRHSAAPWIPARPPSRAPSQSRGTSRRRRRPASDWPAASTARSGPRSDRPATARPASTPARRATRGCRTRRPPTATAPLTGTTAGRRRGCSQPSSKRRERAVG